MAAAALVGAGCHGSGNKAATQPAAANFQVLRRGHLPLSVVIVPGGHVQVVDRADENQQPVNKLVLDKTVGANSVITINPGNPGSLNVNAKPSGAKGPFYRHHIYEIRLLQ